MKKLVRVIDKQANKFRSEIAQKKNELQASKDKVIQEIRAIEKEQKQLKEKFMSKLYTRTTFLPKMFQDQIWAEPNLKEELKIAACFKEEKDIIEALNKMQEQPIVPLNINGEEVVKAPVVAEEHREYVKKAA